MRGIVALDEQSTSGAKARAFIAGHYRSAEALRHPKAASCFCELFKESGFFTALTSLRSE
jgi:hypothetical protein